MAETEVETILREIRERVLSQRRSGQGFTVTAAERSPFYASNEGNGANDSSFAPAQAPENGETVAAENLALSNSYLTTTARAWDRLPPLVSNRSGITARIELWLKRRLKGSTRWFTWEQVNFNAAVHHTLRGIMPVLSAHEQELREVQAKIAAEAEARRILLEQMRAEVEVHRGDVSARVDQLVSELRERDEHLRDEQRVCFKQLALETSETSVLEDRARRKTEALLEELQRRVEQLEK